MKWQDIKQKSEKELNETLASERANLIDLRFRASSGALKQVHKIGQTRKIVAKIKKRLAELAQAAKIEVK